MSYIDYYPESKELLKRYAGLIRACRPNTDRNDKKNIRKAFELACEAHKGMKRKSGEPYVYHPIEVARIAVAEIGLGATSIVCALLHDVVEDTDYTLGDMKAMFGEKVARIIDGLTKMSGVFDQKSSLQAENLRKMLLTICEDVRVILIKLADRLHNMRTLDSMPREKQIKIAGETIYLFAPLAHRLGLYGIKTELEDLGLKYLEPEIYNKISQKLIDSQEERNAFVKTFIKPIEESLKEKGFKYEIFGRVKSIQSIWTKMKTKQVPFEQVYDLFAIRIIIDSTIEMEKTDCWRTYALVTDHYRPNPDRLRDWISVPKSNGYEALHTTVMGPQGKWAEVQIRTRRMDDIAEQGYAAHWRYKESVSSQESALDDWLKKIRELLESPDSNALDFLDDFKLNLFSDEIFVFTPKGDLKTLPLGSTALDFAYNIHSRIGDSCIGAKVNQNLVPINYQLKSGDQVEIISSSKQQPHEEWIDMVITAKAKTKIKENLKNKRRAFADQGRVKLMEFFTELNVDFNKANLEKLRVHMNYENVSELFANTASEEITIKNVRDCLRDTERGMLFKYLRRTIGRSSLKREAGSTTPVVKVSPSKAYQQVLSSSEKTNYSIAPCCNPIPGDTIVGYVTETGEILIHQTNCKIAIQQLSKYGNKVVQAKWTGFEKISFLTGIKLSGVDEIGLVNEITNIISKEQHVNMKSLNFETNEGVFEGTLMLYVQDTLQLKKLTGLLKKVEGVLNIQRIDRNK